MVTIFISIEPNPGVALTSSALMSTVEHPQVIQKNELTWQFKANSVSPSSLIELLTCLDQLGFQLDDEGIES